MNTIIKCLGTLRNANVAKENIHYNSLLFDNLPFLLFFSRYNKRDLIVKNRQQFNLQQCSKSGVCRSVAGENEMAQALDFFPRRCSLTFPLSLIHSLCSFLPFFLLFSLLFILVSDLFIRCTLVVVIFLGNFYLVTSTGRYIYKSILYIRMYICIDVTKIV